MSRFSLDADTAARFARIALGHVRQEYPHKLDHVLGSDEDALPPHVLHPIFFGSFDWHSCVHGWWTLLTLRRLFPDTDEARAIEKLADQSFTAGKGRRPSAHISTGRSAAGSSGLMAGPGCLQLHLEASRHRDANWAYELEPLARAFADRLRDHLGVLTYPIRVGTHFNTAFALVLSLDWAERFDEPLADADPGAGEALVRQRLRLPGVGAGRRRVPVVGADRGPVHGARADRAGIPGWFDSFLPKLDTGEPATLFMPAVVSDRSDGKIAHLDGLNLSRAWCWRSLAPLLPDQEPRKLAYDTAEAHLEAAMPHVAGDYMGEHWLASFALLALLANDT